MNRGGRKGAKQTEVSRSRGFTPHLEGEVACDVREGQYSSEYEVQHVYDDIIPQTRSETLKLQQNIDYYVIDGTGQKLQTAELTENVSYQKHSMLFEFKENIAYEKHSMTIEPEKNVAYQAVCGPQQHKDLLVEPDSIIYETVN